MAPSRSSRPRPAASRADAKSRNSAIGRPRYRGTVECLRTTRIVLVRHGQSTWNADGRWQGQADPPLSALGEVQAQAAADACPAVDAVVASDLMRAQQTAGIIAEQRGFGAVRREPRLRETYTAEWTGLTRDEIEEAWPGWLAADRRPPGFEAWEAVAQRAIGALVDLHTPTPGARCWPWPTPASSGRSSGASTCSAACPRTWAVAGSTSTATAWWRATSWCSSTMPSVVVTAPDQL